MECKNCHSEMPDGYKYCTNCGAPLTAPEPSPETPVETPVPAETPQEPVIPQQPPRPEPADEQPKQPAPAAPAAGAVPAPAAADVPAKRKKSVLPWIIAGVAGVAAIVFLVLFLLNNNKKSEPASVYEYVEEVEEPDVIDWEEEHVTPTAEEYNSRLETTRWISFIKLILNSGNGVTTVIGDYEADGTTVPVKLSLVAEKNNNRIKITGTATYHDDLDFSLSGEGQFDSDGDIACVLKEYNSDGNYTGKWDGWITVQGEKDRFWGSFYAPDGNLGCRFNLLEDNNY